MSSYDKIVKLACKPKPAAPKSKYLEPIIAATWSEDGAVGDVCKALSPRFREPNTVIVFKALIVLHTMIRNGSTDNVLSYLSSAEVLRLKNVSGENWDGYAAPQNLKAYATYLDTRIRAYRDLKHDAIRVQSESNRDMRTSIGFEDDAAPSAPAAKPPTRSKTIMGRKLRVMTVEKGLLRETRVVHRMIDALLQCRLYLDNLEDELVVSALRMLVKDLLVAFQACNEGVINILEHYFEMSHVDAKDALSLYRKFCKQTEQVVEYLTISRKLHNILNISIPNLRHAPVSLAGSLQEYLDDPNFEQNRIEYKLNKSAGDKPRKAGSEAKPTSPDIPPLPSNAPTASSMPAAGMSALKGPQAKQEVVDFFAAIEEEQTPLFNGQPGANATAQQLPPQVIPYPTGAPNPFHQRQMFTGQPMVPHLGTGFPQAPTFGAPPNPFGAPQLQALAPQPTGHRPFSTFLPTQPTGSPASFPPQQMQVGLIPAQPTGFNPFRQSMVLPNATGVQMGSSQPGQANPLPSVFNVPNSAGAVSSFGLQTSPASPPMEVPPRPSSTPLTSFPSAVAGPSPPEAQPVKRHMTGTKNPFGPVPSALPPPVPKVPTLMEIMQGLKTGGETPSPGLPTPDSQPTVGNTSIAPAEKPEGAKSFGFESSALSAGKSDISSIASSFVLDKPNFSSPNSANSTTLPNSSTLPSLPDFSTFSLSTQSSISNPTQQPQTSPSLTSSLAANTTSSSLPQVTSHTTGFSGLKPFKPSSSFGAALLESLPPIPGSSPGTPDVGVASTQSSLPRASSQPPLTASGNSTLGVGLRPQMTGGGANPFRMSMMNAASPQQQQPTQSAPSFSAFGAGFPSITSPSGSAGAGSPGLHLNGQTSAFPAHNASASLI